MALIESSEAACLSDLELDAFVQGRLQGAELVRADEHVDSCDDCRQLIAHVARVGPSTKSEDEQASLPPGTIVGRYIVQEELGTGAMGVVYAAYDSDLDRKIALKLLRPSVVSADSANARMLREAQAMAKLSHPNVVAIYEVGNLDDSFFLAMEFVEGQTLADWLKVEERSFQDVLRVLVAAGRGLAAAHQAGLVHRDFKPQNVLIGEDGRPRVTDFGLVGASGSSSLGAVQADKSSALELTRTGEVMGTPAYMAPEQFKGEATSARTDQFAFCVALCLALYQEPPFAGDSYGELMEHVVEGKLSPPPKRTQVPSWLYSAILQGLAGDPDARYESMGLLLDTLEADPQLKRRRKLLGAGLGLGALSLAGLAAFAFMRGGADPAAVCDGAQDEFIAVWDDDVRTAAKAAFVGTGRPYASDTYERVDKILTGYSKDWVAMHTESCEATRVRGSQSDTLLDLRTQCLARRLGEVAAVSSLLVRGASPSVVDDAVKIASKLTPLDGCADAEALGAVIPLPDDPFVRAKVDALYQRLDRGHALRKAGKFEPGLVVTRAVLEEAKELGYAPLISNALLLVGMLESLSGDSASAETTLRQAARAGAEAGLDRDIAEAWTQLVYVVGHQQSKFDDALGIQDYAETAVARVSGDEDLRASLLNNLATVHLDKGNHEKARGYLDQALASWEKLRGKDHHDVGYALNSLAILARRQGKYAEARQFHERALAIWKNTLGPQHSQVAISLMNLAPVLSGLGENAAALRGLEEALTILEATHGNAHKHVGDCLASLGVLHRRMGNTDEALGSFQRALVVSEGIVGAEHPDVANILYNLGNLALTAKKHEEAASYYQRTLEIREKVFGKEHASVATAHYGLGDVLERQKNYTAAAPHFEQSLAIWEKALGAKHPRVAFALTGLGKSQIGLKRTAEGIVLLERAVAIRESAEADPVDLAEMRFELAKALLLSGGKVRAMKIARMARATYAAHGAAAATELAEVQAWIDAQ